ncbi:MAG: succinylglutamate desuccinylase/aspartoacylase family protein [Pyrinomonadaceae bacterium]
MITTATAIKSEPQRHLIGKFIGKAEGPTLIAVGSIHGNEPSGRLALERVALRLDSLNEKLLGRIYLLAGNVQAIDRAARFVDSDLNRYWTRENILRNTRTGPWEAAEDREQHGLLRIFREVLSSAGDEIYVLDLHSTSAGGIPFATVGDTLRNRRFAQMFPVTILLGIEEQLEGTMLEFLNNEGAVTMGFEAGQHGAAESVDNHEALVWLALVNSGILAAEDVPDLAKHRRSLAESTGKAKILEVRYREPISAGDEFEMKPGFMNFDAVKRGQLLASTRKGSITARETGLMMMPLYQRQGEDGFFIARRVAPFWLRLSQLVRRLRLADHVHLLPGVRRRPMHPETLLIDTSIARLFPLQIFHLLGFRRLRWQKDLLTVSRRRHDTESPFGARKNAIWATK